MFKKIAVIVAMLVLFASVNVNGCCLYSILSKNIENLHQNYSANLAFRESARWYANTQSGTNNDGWGLLFYSSDSSKITYLERSPDQATINGRFGYLVDSLYYMCEPQLVMAHLRNASSGPTTIPDPHPFIWETDNVDYSFEHHGTVSPSAITYFQNNLVPPYNNPNTSVDSELYFLWIMQNIAENDWNIYEGLYDALNDLPNTYWNMNFLFSDGNDLYAFRKGDYSHQIRYTWNDDHNYWLVISCMPNNYWAIPHYDLENYSLLYLSPNGNAVKFDYFMPNGNTICHKRSFHEGWNWSCFPVAPSPSFYGPTFLDEMVTPGTIINVVCGQTGVNAVYENGSWLPIDFDLDNTHLFKMNFTESTPEIYDPDCVYVDGDMRDPDAPTIIDVQGEDQGSGCTYWIGYTLLPTQNIKEAFGSQWDNVRYVFAEDWTYFDGTMNLKRSGGTTTWQSLMKTEGKNIVFGKGYLVRFHNDAPYFTWNYPNTPIWTSSKSEPEYFDPEDKANYEVLEIASIEGSDDVIEIGAFQDGNCIGVTTVDSFPVQLLAYSETNGGEITFQAITSNKGAVNLSQCAIYNENSGVYEEGKLLPRQSLISSIILRSGTTEMINLNKIVSLDQNTPNPFTNSTNISFRLSESRHIFVNVYNLKGELVAKLIDGNYDTGKYVTSWDGKNINGKDVANGLYFYRIETEGKSYSKKMLLIR